MEIKFKIRKIQIETITISPKFTKTPPSERKLIMKKNNQGIIILDNERKLIDGYATLIARERFQEAKKVKCFIIDKHFGDVTDEESKLYANEFKKEWYTLKITKGEEENGIN